MSSEQSINHQFPFDLIDKGLQCHFKDKDVVELLLERIKKWTEDKESDDNQREQV